MVRYNGRTRLLAVLLLSTTTIDALSTTTTPRQQLPVIQVCTGIDCRVDGASDCLRALQKRAKGNYKVRARKCVGPCGDGPCVLVADETGRRVVDQPQENKIQGSLVPPALMGANPKGVFQVRTAGQLEQVIAIATPQGAEKEREVVDDSSALIVTSTRQPYDRPYNERKVMQRLMQFLVLCGVYSYDPQQVGSLQYEIAFGLFLLSSFIMKENMFTGMYKKFLK